MPVQNMMPQLMRRDGFSLRLLQIAIYYDIRHAKHDIIKCFQVLKSIIISNVDAKRFQKCERLICSVFLFQAVYLASNKFFHIILLSVLSWSSFRARIFFESK